MILSLLGLCIKFQKTCFFVFFLLFFFLVYYDRDNCDSNSVMFAFTCGIGTVLILYNVDSWHCKQLFIQQ